MTVDLHHADEGPRDAPVLVLSGSLGSTMEMWRPQVGPLTERFRVIRLDHRGHGGSPVAPGPYRMADLAGDALALLDRLGLDRVSWCGLSLGGMVGMYLASEAPERIATLTLCCTTSHFPDTTVWKERIAAVSTGGTATLAEGIVSRWFTPDWAAAHPDVVAEAAAMVAGTSDSGYVACCQAIEVWDHRDRLGAISAPTLVIAGSADPSTPVEPHARTLADGIPGARLEVLEAAHLATIEAADEANALIADHAGGVGVCGGGRPPANPPDDGCTDQLSAASSRHPTTLFDKVLRRSALADDSRACDRSILMRAGESARTRTR